ncbi:type VII secretion target [Nocardia abscessus]|uniref:type VII secretion target n=2 Tax=Nocardia abscessus TaxID=120957 RepID=UPI002454458C|nr:type VII secretion target [Nocardia abscessus]
MKISSRSWGFNMAAPSKDAVSVAVDQVRSAATNWDEAAAALEEARKLTEKAKFERLEAGVFALAYDKYKSAPDFVHDRMKEGIEVFNDIAQTLRQVADTYQAEDERREHEIRDLY